MKNYFFFILAFLFASVTLQAETIVCSTPSGVQVQRTSDTEATIAIAGGGTLFDFYIKPAGDPAPTPTTAPRPGFDDVDLSTPFTSNVLVAQFGYDVWIRTQCTGETSAWVGPFYIAQYDATCTAPASLNIDRSSHTEASVTGAAGVYDFYVVAEGNAGPMDVWTGPNSYGANDVDLSSPYNRTDLAEGIAYDVYYRVQCNESQVTEWQGPINVPVYVDPCPAPVVADIMTDRTSETTAEISGADPAFTYQGSANRPGRPLRPYPMYGMENMSMPHTQSGLIPEFDYDVWLRTECPDGSFSEWVGPFYVPTYATPCAEPTNITVDRTSDSTATITADDTSVAYDLYIKPQGFPAPTASTAPRPGFDNLTFPFTSNDLEQQFGYDVYVRTNCGSETSDWVGPIYVAPYSTPCPAPVVADIVTTRTSDTTAEFTGADPAYTYQGTANRAGRPLRPYPMYGMENMTMPHTQSGLIPAFDYDVWFRTECPGGTFSEWVGPFYVPTYTAACEDVANVQITRSGNTGTITADRTDQVYDLYIVLAGNPGPSAGEEPNVHGDDDITFPHTRNDLAPQISYDIYVRTQCDATTTTAWVGPFTAAATQKVMLSPNPAKGLVQIEGMDAVSVQVINMNGATELKTSVTNNQVNIENLAPGQYILQATDALGNVTTTKLMKK